MARNKIKITASNSAEWLASLGFIFPTNELELARFDKLFGQTDPDITGKEVDPFRIIKGESQSIKSTLYRNISSSPSDPYRMVARNMNDLPSHILDKIKKNQQPKSETDESNEKKED